MNIDSSYLVQLEWSGLPEHEVLLEVAVASKNHTGPTAPVLQHYFSPIAFTSHFLPNHDALALSRVLYIQK